MRRTTTWSWGLLPTAGLVLAIGSGRAPLPVSATLMNPFPIVAAGCSDCVGCIGGHLAPEGSDQGGIHGWCMQIAGCTGHSTCTSEGGGYEEPGGEELLYALVMSALNGDHGAVEVLLAEFPARAYLNAARRALQVTGCTPGTVLAHVSLSEQAYAYLSGSASSVDSPSPL